MNINLMTWNIDWFRNGCRSGKDMEYFEEDSNYEVYNNVIAIVKEFLEKENSVVFLQEVPFKAKGERWHQHYLYKEIYKDFPPEEYDIKVNDNFAYRCTMAISLKNTFDNNVSYYPKNNRTVAVRKNDIVFMGVHMPTGLKTKDDDDTMWTDLISFVKSSDKNIVICGDFNVFIGCKCKQKLTEERYKELLGHAGYCEPDGDAKSKPTFKDLSHIDYILVRNDLKDRVKSYKIFEEGKRLSDHEPLIIDIDI